MELRELTFQERFERWKKRYPHGTEKEFRQAVKKLQKNITPQPLVAGQDGNAVIRPSTFEDRRRFSEANRTAL
jgi:hypothetical protein